MVVLYTDSLIEAKDSSGKRLGTDGLLGVAEGLDPSDPAEFMQSLLDAVGQEDIGLQSSDDVTVLILRANAMKPRPTLGVELTAHGRMLLTLLGKLRPGAPAFPWPDVGPLSRLAAFLHRLNPRWGLPRP